MWSLGIVMLPQVMMMMIVMIIRPPRRMFLQALPSMRSLLSLNLHHASWLRPLRYNLVMMKVIKNMMMIMKMKMIVIMMNLLKMNYLNAKACVKN